MLYKINNPPYNYIAKFADIAQSVERFTRNE